MKYDVILAGVGGQGVLSVASIIADAAVGDRLNVRQSEVHGMAQRGGAVLAHLRIADMVIPGDLVPKGAADLIISMEPLEGLRYLGWLKQSGALVSASEAFVNINNYPEPENIKSTIRGLPQWRLVDAHKLAKEAGFPKAVNTVMVGAASCFLPVSTKSLEKAVVTAFERKDASVVQANIRAFSLGQEAGRAKETV
ncbi:MAG: indolepyruvate oxidoreductase subunit beta [Treponema sp.]|jgi:indolepyruvate ferredoxin oxidoreductase beta subunit|nr:indolepyruvate oxidoreductase subunit beta [Treponema sp.]